MSLRCMATVLLGFVVYMVSLLTLKATDTKLRPHSSYLTFLTPRKTPSLHQSQQGSIHDILGEATNLKQVPCFCTSSPKMRKILIVSSILNCHSSSF